MHRETDAPAAIRCLDCSAWATHGLLHTTHGLYVGTRVPNGARWCKAHSIEAATLRNASITSTGRRSAP